MSTRKESVPAAGTTRPEKRGRGPSPDKTAETKRKLIEAALETFLDKGFANTRMSDVAGRAGFAKGTLYLHFADKDAMFEGVLREVVSASLVRITTLSPRRFETVRAFLSRTVTPVLREFEISRRASFIRIVVIEGGRYPEIANTYRTVVLEPLTEVIRRLAKLAHDKGELQTDVLTRQPLLLLSPGILATLWNGLYGDDELMDTAAVFEGFLDLIFYPKTRRAR